MNRWVSRLSLEHKLPLAITGLLALVIGGFSWAAYQEVGRAAIGVATDRLERVTDQLASILSTSARQRVAEARATARLPALRDYLADPSAARRPRAVATMDSVKTSGALVAAVELWDRAGRPVVVMGDDRASRDSAAASALVAATGDSALVGPFQIVRDTLFYAVAAAVPRDGNVAGYLVQRRRVVSQGAQQLSDLIGSDAGLLIGNRAGDLWTDFATRVEPPPTDLPAQGGTVFYEAPDVGGVLARAVPVQFTPWLVVVEFRRDRILARARATLGRLALIALVIVALGTAGAWAMSRRITAPLGRLTHSAEAIAQGRPPAAVVTGRADEIGRLADAFNSMAAQVAQARQGLETQVAERTRELEEARRRLEQTSEERYRILFHRNPLPMWVYHQETLQFLDVNEAAVRHYGYSREEFLHMTLKDIRPPEDVPHLLETIGATPTGLYEAGVWRHRTKDGRVIDVEITRHQLEIGGRRLGLVLAHDVTARLVAERARRESEEALRRLAAELEDRVEERTAQLRGSEERFRTLAETANDAIVSADARGCITYFNPGAERIFGYAADEVVGQPLTILMPERLHEAHRTGFTRHLATGEARVVGRTVELAGRRKDGSEFPVELSLASWRAGGQPSFTGILRDITDRKHAEEARAEHARALDHANAELQAVNKELEAFSYSVSHDLRAPLRAIDGFSRILLEDQRSRLDAEAQRVLDVIRKNTRQMGQLIDDLLAFSRLGRKELVAAQVDMTALARAVADELGQADGGRSLEVAIDPLPPAYGDRALLRQVWANLLQNAFKFTRGRPAPRIHVSAHPEGDETVYLVTDNGVGFDMDYAPKLFGVFQRLHRAEEFEGTGVGLAIVQRVVHRHGGRVWAEGAVNRGATFYFTLPKEPPAA